MGAMVYQIWWHALLFLMGFSCCWLSYIRVSHILGLKARSLYPLLSKYLPAQDTCFSLTPSKHIITMSSHGILLSHQPWSKIQEIKKCFVLVNKFIIKKYNFISRKNLISDFPFERKFLKFAVIIWFQDLIKKSFSWQ